MRGPLKQAGLKALKYSRGLDMLGYSPWRSRRLLILCYHGISEGDELEWRPSLYVTPEMFRWRMELLRSEQFHVLSLSEGLDRLYRRALPPRSVVITFDDGFANFTQFALPILKEYGFPATVYLTTYYSQHRWPIFPLICSYLLWKGRDRSLIIPDMGIEQTELRTLDSREIVFHRLCRFAQEQRLSGQEKDQMASQVADALQIDYGSLCRERLFHLMTAEDVRAASSEGIDFQLHTHRHRSPADRTQFIQEIEDNRHWIRDVTENDPKHFCYPSGNFQERFVGWLQDQGVVSATTCEHGLASADTDAFQLPRFLDHLNITSLEYEAWLTGLVPLLRVGRYHAY